MSAGAPASMGDPRSREPRSSDSLSREASSGAVNPPRDVELIAAAPAEAMVLSVRTPWALALREEVVALTAEDESGRFGLRPGAEATVAAIVPGVLYARRADESERWIAVGSGMLRSGRYDVEVCVRQAIVCASLAEVNVVLGDLDARIAEGETQSRESFRFLYRRMLLRLAQSWGRR